MYVLLGGGGNEIYLLVEGLQHYIVPKPTLLVPYRSRQYHIYIHILSALGARSLEKKMW